MTVISGRKERAEITLAFEESGCSASSNLIQLWTLRVLVSEWVLELLGPSSFLSMLHGTGRDEASVFCLITCWHGPANHTMEVYEREKEDEKVNSFLVFKRLVLGWSLLQLTRTKLWSLLPRSAAYFNSSSSSSSALWWWWGWVTTFNTVNILSVLWGYM